MWLPQAASELTFASLIQAICSFHHANDTNGNHGLFNRWMFLSGRQIVLSRLMLCAVINTWEKSFLGGNKKLSRVPLLLASRQREGLPCTRYLCSLNFNRAELSTRGKIETMWEDGWTQRTVIASAEHPSVGKDGSYFPIRFRNRLLSPRAYSVSQIPSDSFSKYKCSSLFFFLTGTNTFMCGCDKKEELTHTTLVWGDWQVFILMR